MPLSQAQKQRILDLYPQAQLVYTKNGHHGEVIVIILDQTRPRHQQLIPETIYSLPTRISSRPPITDLRFPLPLPEYPARDPHLAEHQRCHNEPVPGGIQLQPRGAGWVGTLGTACSFADPAGDRRWGILSNWHVMVTGSQPGPHPQHQPTDQYPAIAHLTDFEEVTGSKTNYIDAAVADAEINGLHSVGPNLLGAGRVASETKDAIEGASVAKSGRTTGYQQGVCVGTGAAVQIGYGNFTATFADQDVFEGTSGQFSGPGDSGSLIFGRNCLCPTALLFAGGGDITIGCPMRYIVDRFQIHFRFPE